MGGGGRGYRSKEGGVLSGKDRARKFKGGSLGKERGVRKRDLLVETTCTLCKPSPSPPLLPSPFLRITDGQPGKGSTGGDSQVAGVFSCCTEGVLQLSGFRYSESSAAQTILSLLLHGAQQLIVT